MRPRRSVLTSAGRVVMRMTHLRTARKRRPGVLVPVTVPAPGVAPSPYRPSRSSSMPIALVGRSVRVLTAISLIAVVVACLVVPASAQEEDDSPAWTRELQEMVREIMAAQAAVEDALRAGKAGRAWAAIER